MDEYYVISINDDIKYYLSIINDDNTKIILAGGINNNCIKVIIYEKENIAIIHDVFYNKKCRLNTYLKKRDSMELLLKSVLCFLYDKYETRASFRGEVIHIVLCMPAHRASSNKK